MAQWTHVKDYFRIGRTVIGTKGEGTFGDVRYLHQDHLGSTRLVTNSDGTVRGAHQYWPYGRVAGTPTLAEPVAGFTGHERDQNKLGIYMLGRTYIEGLLTFSSPDQARDGWNLYGYVGGNPIKNVDPDGQTSLALPASRQAE